MKDFLQASGNPFTIYIIEQSDDGRKFNRGKLLNVGFDIASKEGCQIFILHDVDLLPSKELSPSYTTVPSQPVHIARVWERYSDNPKYFGGIVAFSLDMYKQINGFPNNFWGWGGEDDELYNRITLVSFKSNEIYILLFSLFYPVELIFPTVTLPTPTDGHEAYISRRGCGEGSRGHVSAGKIGLSQEPPKVEMHE